MWRREVERIIDGKGRTRVNGKVASERTRRLTKEVMCAAISRLHDLGYKLQDPKNIGERHVSVLMKDAWYNKKKKIKTIQNELSRMRVFCGMLGKVGMVGRLEKYLPDIDPKQLVVHTSARRSKSWSAYDINLVEKFKEVDAKDWRLGLMLRLEVAFGLRRQEVLKCDPHAQDYGNYLQVFPGHGKGGRWRNVPILSPAQRTILDFVKSQVPKNEPLGWKCTKSGKVAGLKQNIRRYENLMVSLGFTKAGAGVTGHGLRAQFAENQSLLMDILPPTLGGTSNQMAREDLRMNRTRLAQALGHNRYSITNAYIGSFGNSRRPMATEEGLKTLQDALTLLERNDLPAVPVERIDDCLTIKSALAVVGVIATLEQAHRLWSEYACRYGVAWMSPESDLGVALEAAALTVTKQLSTQK
jgi:integrase